MPEARKPNQEEATQLAFHIHHRCGFTESLEEAELWVEATCVAVFDDYITDGPGYAGKLMMVVWTGGPDLYEVFIWRDGKLTPVNQEPGFSIWHED
jgi:hypothetical protein